MSEPERTSRPPGERQTPSPRWSRSSSAVAQPVWVVDHDGLVVFVNPAGLAALGYDDLSELQGRFGHDAIHYKHRDGSPYPAEDCPMTKVRGTGESIQMEEDWFVRRDGSMFPVSYTSTPLDTARRPGGGRRLQGHRGAARGRAGAARARGDPRDRRPAGLGHRRRGRFHYANPAGAGRARLRRRSPTCVGKPAHDTVHYKYPDGSPFPEEDCPLVQARATRGESCRTPRTGSCARTARSCASPTRPRRFELPTGLGSVTAFTDVEEQRRAERGRARARRRPGAGGGAAGRPAADHRGRRRGARPARARPARWRPAAVRQRDAPAAARRAR